ncbi:MAG: hypothetical protein OXF25_07505 [Cyanobacteria bacterium MAG CAR3_bin_5]|nr:hypothetical protein [Cyanobacteria bacterium MAG CAR4_bin_6]MCY4173896.1 hypothetical protein [Cyanobacteria bacterium MAG CAR3_bin_5]MCY4236538.1 hypothetical protein [Cyanobacteria bacterium MAG CAR2_bin_4]
MKPRTLCVVALIRTDGSGMLTGTGSRHLPGSLPFANVTRLSTTKWRRLSMST